MTVSIPLGEGRSTLFYLLAIVLICSVSCVHVLSAETGHDYVIFQDDFESGTADAWEMWTPPGASSEASWAIFYEDGNNVLNLKGAVIAKAGDPDWSDYTIEVRVKIVEGQDEAHINVRMGDPAPRYFVRLPKQDLFFSKEYQAEFPDLAKADMERGDDTWCLIRVACVGGEFRVYVDDELKIEHSDEEDPILSGRIGLECGPGSTIYFDDVKVYSTHLVYVEHLIELAEDEINRARIADADTDEAVELLEEANDKLAEGDLSAAESLSKDAAAKAIFSRLERASSPETPQPETRTGVTWSVERIATLITIGGAAVGVAGWMSRTRSERRKRAILYKELMQGLDDIYTRFKMNARQCESELYRFKDRAINELKQGMITEENYNILDRRLEEYIREVRREIERRDA